MQTKDHRIFNARSIDRILKFSPFRSIAVKTKDNKTSFFFILQSQFWQILTFMCTQSCDWGSCLCHVLACAWLCMHKSPTKQKVQMNMKTA